MRTESIITLSRETYQAHNGHGYTTASALVLAHGGHEFEITRTRGGHILTVIDRSKDTGGLSAHWQYHGPWITLNRRGVLATREDDLAPTQEQITNALAAYRAYRNLVDR